MASADIFFDEMNEQKKSDPTFQYLSKQLSCQE